MKMQLKKKHILISVVLFFLFIVESVSIILFVQNNGSLYGTFNSVKKLVNKDEVVNQCFAYNEGITKYRFDYENRSSHFDLKFLSNNNVIEELLKEHASAKNAYDKYHDCVIRKQSLFSSDVYQVNFYLYDDLNKAHQDFPYLAEVYPYVVDNTQSPYLLNGLALEDSVINYILYIDPNIEQKVSVDRSIFRRNIDYEFINTFFRTELNQYQEDEVQSIFSSDTRYFDLLFTN